MDKKSLENFEPTGEGESYPEVVERGEKSPKLLPEKNNEIGQELMKYYPMIRVYVDSHLRNKVPTQEIDDITQKIIIKAWEKYHTFRGESAFLSWLFPITKNTVIDEARKVQKDFIWKGMPDKPKKIENTSEFGEGSYPGGFEQIILDEGKPDTTKNIEQDLHKKEKRSQIMAMLKRLPEQQQRVTELHYYEDLSVEEIAQKLKISQSAVKKSLFDARNSILKQIPNRMKKALKQK